MTWKTSSCLASASHTSCWRKASSSSFSSSFRWLLVLSAMVLVTFVIFVFGSGGGGGATEGISTNSFLHSPSSSSLSSSAINVGGGMAGQNNSTGGAEKRPINTANEPNSENKNTEAGEGPSPQSSSSSLLQHWHSQRSRSHQHKLDFLVRPLILLTATTMQDEKASPSSQSSGKSRRKKKQQQSSKSSAGPAATKTAAAADRRNGSTNAYIRYTPLLLLTAPETTTTSQKPAQSSSFSSGPLKGDSDAQLLMLLQRWYDRLPARLLMAKRNVYAMRWNTDEVLRAEYEAKYYGGDEVATKREGNAGNEYINGSGTAAAGRIDASSAAGEAETESEEEVNYGAAGGSDGRDPEKNKKSGSDDDEEQQQQQQQKDDNEKGASIQSSGDGSNTNRKKIPSPPPMTPPLQKYAATLLFARFCVHYGAMNNAPIVIAELSASTTATLASAADGSVADRGGGVSAASASSSSNASASSPISAASSAPILMRDGCCGRPRYREGVHRDYYLRYGVGDINTQTQLRKRKGLGGGGGLNHHHYDSSDPSTASDSSFSSSHLFDYGNWSSRHNKRFTGTARFVQNTEIHSNDPMPMSLPPVPIPDNAPQLSPTQLRQLRELIHVTTTTTQRVGSENEETVKTGSDVVLSQALAANPHTAAVVLPSPSEQQQERGGGSPNTIYITYFGEKSYHTNLGHALYRALRTIVGARQIIKTRSRRFLPRVVAMLVPSYSGESMGPFMQPLLMGSRWFDEAIVVPDDNKRYDAGTATMVDGEVCEPSPSSPESSRRSVVVVANSTRQHGKKTGGGDASDDTREEEGEVTSVSIGGGGGDALGFDSPDYDERCDGATSHFVAFNNNKKKKLTTATANDGKQQEHSSSSLHSGSSPFSLLSVRPMKCYDNVLHSNLVRFEFSRQPFTDFVKGIREYGKDLAGRWALGTAAGCTLDGHVDLSFGGGSSSNSGSVTKKQRRRLIRVVIVNRRGASRRIVNVEALQQSVYKGVWEDLCGGGAGNGTTTATASSSPSPPYVFEENVATSSDSTTTTISSPSASTADPLCPFRISVRVVELEDYKYSLRDQASFFHCSDVVLSVHGAAIAWSIAMRQHFGSALLEIFPYDWIAMDHRQFPVYQALYRGVRMSYRPMWLGLMGAEGVKRKGVAPRLSAGEVFANNITIMPEDMVELQRAVVEEVRKLVAR